jgi:hypothetical protein
MIFIDANSVRTRKLELYEAFSKRLEANPYDKGGQKPDFDLKISV